MRYFPYIYVYTNPKQNKPILCDKCKIYEGLIQWLVNYFLKQRKFRNDTIAYLNDYNYRDIFRSNRDLTKMLIAFYDKGKTLKLNSFGFLWLINFGANVSFLL